MGRGIVRGFGIAERCTTTAMFSQGRKAATAKNGHDKFLENGDVIEAVLAVASFVRATTNGNTYEQLGRGRPTPHYSPFPANGDCPLRAVGCG